MARKCAITNNARLDWPRFRFGAPPTNMHSNITRVGGRGYCRARYPRLLDYSVPSLSVCVFVLLVCNRTYRFVQCTFLHTLFFSVRSANTSFSAGPDGHWAISISKIYIEQLKAPIEIDVGPRRMPREGVRGTWAVAQMSVVSGKELL